MEKTGGGKFAGSFLAAACPGGGRRRSPERPTVPTNRATESRTRLAEKKLACPVEQKRHLVEPWHEQLSQQRQGELLGLARSSYY